MKKDSLANLLDNWNYKYKIRKWEKYYAWRPVRDVYGVWHWRTTLYRMVGNTYVDYDDWAWFFYMSEVQYTWFILRWS